MREFCKIFFCYTSPKFFSLRYKIDTALVNFYSLLNTVTEKHKYKPKLKVCNLICLSQHLIVNTTDALIKLNTVFSLE